MFVALPRLLFFTENLLLPLLLHFMPEFFSTIRVCSTPEKKKLNDTVVCSLFIVLQPDLCDKIFVFRG
jgi:hypothetical protein